MFKVKFTILSLFVFVFIGLSTNAQKNVGGTPYSFTEEFQDQFTKEKTAVYNLAKPDVATALREDKESSTPSNRFALSVPVNLTMENSGSWLELDNGDRIWRLKIEAKDAKQIFCSMEDFYLPDEALLYVYDENREQIRGAFSSFNNRDSKTFIFSMLDGSEMTLEYYEPKQVKGEGSFSITKVYYGYKAAAADPAEEDASCQYENVNCAHPEDTDWYWASSTNHWKKSVARVIIITPDGAKTCSGSLINNTAADETPYFLTADHCICESTVANFNNYIFEFNYEEHCSGTLKPVVSVIGCDLKATSPSSDGALLELSSLPNVSILMIMGWDRSANNHPESSSVHHPGLSPLKKVSIDNDPTTINPYAFNGPCGELLCSGCFFDTQFEVGAVSAGSSGAPLINANKRIIGQLLGTTETTEQSCNIIFGRLNKSWSAFTSFLCPSGTCPITLDEKTANSVGSSCRVSSLKETDQITLGQISKFIVNDLDQNFIEAQDAFITYEKEIMDLLESKSNKKINYLYNKVKKEGYKLLMKSFAFKKSVVVTNDQYLLLDELLEEMKKATYIPNLKVALADVQKHLPAIEGKELKDALIAFDKSDSPIALKNGNSEYDFSEVKLLNSLSNISTLAFQSAYGEGELTAKLYDSNGKEVLQLINCEKSLDGNYQYDIDKTNLSNGIYIIKVMYETENVSYQETLKLPVLK